MQKMRTLGEFIVEKQHDFPHASGELSSLLASIRLAAKIVNREINKAGLADIIGASGNDNIQGEEQQKLDLYANEKFKAALEARDQVCGVASEEEDEAVAFSKEQQKCQIRGVDGSARWLFQYRCERIGWDHFLDLPPRFASWHTADAGGLSPTG